MKRCPDCYSAKEDLEYVDDMEGPSTTYYCSDCDEYYDYDELVD